MKRSHIFLVGILFLFFGVGVLGVMEFWHYLDLPPSTWYQVIANPVVFWMCLMGLLYSWIKADANDRSIPLSLGTSILVPLLFPIGIPYYYLRTYATRSALLHIGLAVLFVGACIATARLGAELTFEYYAVWTNPRTQ